MSTTDPITAEQLDILAAALDAVSKKYREIASEMRSEEIQTIDLTGMKTAVGRSLELLRGHVRRASNTVARHLDAKADAMLSSNPTQLVRDDTRAAKRVPKAKKPRE